MEVKAVYKYARISAKKMRDVAQEIQGLSVSQATDILSYTPKKGAYLLNKTLKSALANAENNAELSVDTLVVKSVMVDEGPTTVSYTHLTLPTIYDAPHDAPRPRIRQHDPQAYIPYYRYPGRSRRLGLTNLTHI